MSGNVCFAPRGVGEVEFISLPDPAAGAFNPNWAFFCPAGEIWRLLSLHYVLVTSAVAGNRLSVVSIESAGAVTWWRSGSTAATQQVANTTRRYVHSINNGDSERVGYDVTGALELFHLPLGDTFLSAGDQVNGFFVAFDTTAVTGDQFSELRLIVQKWRTV